jgi:integrase
MALVVRRLTAATPNAAEGPSGILRLDSSASSGTVCRVLAALRPCLVQAALTSPQAIVTIETSVVSTGRSAKEKKLRQKRQLASAAERPIVERLATLGIPLTTLQASAVARSTQLNYTIALERLLVWMLVPQLPQLRPELLDELLEEYASWLFDKGVPLSVASTTAAAVRWALPMLLRPLAKGLPPLMASIAGWKKKEPSRSRDPVPRIAAVAICLHLCQIGHFQAAAIVMIMFETYMRPSEILAMTAMQLVAPQRVGIAEGTQRVWSFLVRASELGVAGKTGEYDTSIALDLERQQFLFPLLETMVASLAPLARLWTIGYAELAHSFSVAIQELGLSALGLTLYGLRHGGASHNRAVGARGLPEVQKRGGWKAFSSVRRYEKHARLNLVANRMPPRLVETTLARLSTLAQCLRMR